MHVSLNLPIHSPPPLPSWYPYICSCICVSISALWIRSSIPVFFSRFHIYALMYDICFSLFLTSLSWQYDLVERFKLNFLFHPPSSTPFQNLGLACLGVSWDRERWDSPGWGRVTSGSEGGHGPPSGYSSSALQFCYKGGQEEFQKAWFIGPCLMRHSHLPKSHRDPSVPPFLTNLVSTSSCLAEGSSEGDGKRHKGYMMVASLLLFING